MIRINYTGGDALDHLLNRDVYLEGPVLMQGYLHCEMSRITSMECGQKSSTTSALYGERMWMVIRPRSVSNYIYARDV